MSKHTPGPWLVDDDEEFVTVISQNTAQEIADCQGMNYDKEVLANARLIAAAPELLEALKELNDTSIWANASLAKLHNKVKAAIAKADGQ